jgi:2'-5' RNA ligase
MRLFIGIPVRPETSARLRKAMNACPDRDMIRLTGTDRYHVTLLFLGERDPSQIPVVTRAMDDASRGSLPVTLSCEGIRIFSRRTIVTPVTAGREQLTELAQDLAVRLQLPIPSDDTIWHLSLARIPKGVRTDLRLIRETMDPKIRARIELDTIVLYRSHIGHTSVRYEALHTIRL